MAETPHPFLMEGQIFGLGVLPLPRATHKQQHAHLHVHTRQINTASLSVSMTQATVEFALAADQARAVAVHALDQARVHWWKRHSLSNCLVALENYIPFIYGTLDGINALQTASGEYQSLITYEWYSAFGTHKSDKAESRLVAFELAMILTSYGLVTYNLASLIYARGKPVDPAIRKVVTASHTKPLVEEKHEDNSEHDNLPKQILAKMRALTHLSHSHPSSNSESTSSHGDKKYEHDKNEKEDIDDETAEKILCGEDAMALLRRAIALFKHVADNILPALIPVDEKPVLLAEITSSFLTSLISICGAAHQLLYIVQDPQDKSKQKDNKEKDKMADIKEKRTREMGAGTLTLMHNALKCLDYELEPGSKQYYTLVHTFLELLCATVSSRLISFYMNEDDRPMASAIAETAGTAVRLKHLLRYGRKSKQLKYMIKKEAQYYTRLGAVLQDNLPQEEKEALKKSLKHANILPLEVEKYQPIIVFRFFVRPAALEDLKDKRKKEKKKAKKKHVQKELEKDKIKRKKKKARKEKEKGKEKEGFDSEAAETEVSENNEVADSSEEDSIGSHIKEFGMIDGHLKNAGVKARDEDSERDDIKEDEMSINREEANDANDDKSRARHKKKKLAQNKYQKDADVSKPGDYRMLADLIHEKHEPTKHDTPTDVDLGQTESQKFIEAEKEDRGSTIQDRKEKAIEEEEQKEKTDNAPPRHPDGNDEIPSNKPNVHAKIEWAKERMLAELERRQRTAEEVKLRGLKEGLKQDKHHARLIEQHHEWSSKVEAEMLAQKWREEKDHLREALDSDNRKVADVMKHMPTYDNTLDLEIVLPVVDKKAGILEYSFSSANKLHAARYWAHFTSPFLSLYHSKEEADIDDGAWESENVVQTMCLFGCTVDLLPRLLSKRRNLLHRNLFHAEQTSKMTENTPASPQHHHLHLHRRKSSVDISGSPSTRRLHLARRRSSVVMPTNKRKHSIIDARRMTYALSRGEARAWMFRVHSGSSVHVFVVDNFVNAMHWLHAIRAAAGAEHRLGSCAPVHKGEEVQCLVDGEEMYESVYRAIQRAHQQIFIAGWWLIAEIHLKRAIPKTTEDGQGMIYEERPSIFWRLDQLLLSKAREGVRVYLLLWHDTPWIMKLTNSDQISKLEKMHENIRGIAHPKYYPITWSHHQKLVVVDQQYALLGGFDLAYGRWDYYKHNLADEHHLFQLYPGLDYFNETVKDVLDDCTEPWTDSLDRTETPRLPYHDCHLVLGGNLARDAAATFIQRWNAFKEADQLTLLPPHKTPSRKAPAAPPVKLTKLLRGIFPNLKQRYSSKTKAQLVRSLGNWSGANNTEISLYSAYLSVISKAKHYIYIENQFFISSTAGDEVQNTVAAAVYDRLAKAIRKKRRFRVFVIIPYTSAGSLLDAFKIQILLYWTHRTICKGKTSIWQRLQEEFPDVDMREYITFNTLRTYALMEKGLISGPIYVHSKLLIVDDKYVIIGSANVNDRSMLGDRDSELAVVLKDQNTFESKMDGRPYMAHGLAYHLRMRLWGEHLGTLLKTDAKSLAKQQVYGDPICPESWNIWKHTAKRNTRLYHKIFYEMPHDDYVNMNIFKEMNALAKDRLRFRPQTTMENLEENKWIMWAYEKLKKKVGDSHLAEFPLTFLSEQEIEMSLYSTHTVKSLQLFL